MMHSILLRNKCIAWPNLCRPFAAMKTITRYISLFAVAVCLTAAAANAAPVTIDLNAVDTSAGPVDATALLGWYGVTITDSSVATPLYIYSNVQNPYVTPDSPPNFLDVAGQNNPPTISFTLDFSGALDSINFTDLANNAANLQAEWTLTAYSGATALDSVGQSFGEGSFSPEPFTLTGPDITSVTFSGDGFGVAGQFSLWDDITLNQTAAVPDATSTFGLLAVALAALLAARRRWATV
jgi:VPDSG-CTERM motif